jgi:hypothetical protein
LTYSRPCIIIRPMNAVLLNPVAILVNLASSTGATG